MDIRDDIHTQIEEHVHTLHILAKLDNIGAELVAVEVRRYLEESAVHLETFVLPKVEAKTPHVDLRGNAPATKIAAYVGATSVEAADEGERAADDAAPSFLLSGRK